MGPHCTGPPPPPAILLVTSGSQDWTPVQTCSLVDSPSNGYLHLVATEAHTVDKRVVCILLECFLVSKFYGKNRFRNTQDNTLFSFTTIAHFFPCSQAQNKQYPYRKCECTFKKSSFSMPLSSSISLSVN